MLLKQFMVSPKCRYYHKAKESNKKIFILGRWGSLDPENENVGFGAVGVFNFLHGTLDINQYIAFGS